MKQSELNSELMKLLQSLNPKSQKDPEVPLVLIAEPQSPKLAERFFPEPHIVLIVPEDTKSS